MLERGVSRYYHRVIIIGLVLLNLLCITLAIWDGDPGQRDWHFRDGSLINSLGAAQMLGAALLFIACFFAENIVPGLKQQERKPHAWLVFALGFLVLAVDQQLRLRETLTLLIDGGRATSDSASLTHSSLKIVTTLLAVALVIYYRSVILANMRTVLTFAAGFWFLLLMLLFDMLFESIGMPVSVVVIMEGSAKLLAVAMFLSAAFVALLDRLAEARSVNARLAILEDWHCRRTAEDRRQEQEVERALRAAEEAEERGAGAEPPTKRAGAAAAAENAGPLAGGAAAATAEASAERAAPGEGEAPAPGEATKRPTGE